MTHARMAAKRILFFAEAVTLAHVARPVVLARSLDTAQYEIHFATAQRYPFCFDGTNFQRHAIHSLDPDQFLKRLTVGARLYDEAQLAQYIEDDLRVMDEVRPDMVVGDFRVSLAVSAALRKIPYAALTNAHWSPYSAERYFPVPEHPMTKILGVATASFFFHRLQRFIFAYHASPINRLRRKHGLAEIGDIRNYYTHGDYTLYADTPNLVPTPRHPPHHLYLGPILWDPALLLPTWWQHIPESKPCIYLTLGSSGAAALLPGVVGALQDLPVNIMIATAGRCKLKHLPDNVFVADYLPGLAAARRSQLVICSGGSATAYQALSAGVPIIGIPSNMDQHLTMNAIAAAGAGQAIRSEWFTAGKLRKLTQHVLADSSYTLRAQTIAKEFSQYDATKKFPEFIARHA